MKNNQPTNQPNQLHGTLVIYNLLQFNMRVSYYLVTKPWVFFASLTERKHHQHLRIPK